MVGSVFRELDHDEAWTWNVVNSIHLIHFIENSYALNAVANDSLKRPPNAATPYIVALAK